MSYWRLIASSLTFHAWSHLPVVLGCLVGCAVLTGSLLVGDSMRGTLRSITLERLGNTDLALVGTTFFDPAVANRWTENQPALERDVVAGVILVRGAVVHAKQGGSREEHRAGGVQIVGTSPAFFELMGVEADEARELSSQVVVNQRLADMLAARAGDRVILRMEKASDVPREGLLGRSSDVVRSLPVTVDQVAADEGFGRFSLEMTQRIAPTLFLPQSKLSPALEQKGLVNALLVDQAGSADVASAQAKLDKILTLEDRGLFLRRDADWVRLEARERIVSPAIAGAIEKVVSERGLAVQRVMTYLCNAITPMAGDESSVSVPYSVVTGLDGWSRPPFGPLPVVRGKGEPAPGEVLLNEWTANRLRVNEGSAIKLDYFAVEEDGSLRETSVTRRVAGVVAMRDQAVDRTFAPDYPGITDADTFADWDAPFPVELKRVKDEDEKYWKDYRTAPKVYLALEDAQKLWRTRFGGLTSLRVAPGAGETVDALAENLAKDLDRALPAGLVGLRLWAVRETELAASSGSTDFGMLFVSMSFFLIVSSALLVGLLFRLNTERRASSIGVLLAVGNPPSRVRGLLLAEGLVLAVVGSLSGLLAAVLYARLLVWLLSSWWQNAVGTSFIQFHADPMSFVVGLIASVLVALLAVVWATMRIDRTPVPALLGAGFVFAHRPTRWGRRLASILSGLGIVVGVGLVIAGGLGWLPEAAGFFGGGFCLLMGASAALARYLNGPLSKDPASLVTGDGWSATGRLGVRNARRYPSRSLVTAILLALAVFLVVAVGTMRHGKPPRSPTRNSGNGGYALLGQSTTPLGRDLSDEKGRFDLNVSDEASEILRKSRVDAFRVRSGDDASCLNIYQPKQPTLLAASKAFIERGGFAFASSLASTDAERANPWRLLERDWGEGVVPAIGDAATLQWILKVPVGQELSVTAEDGRPVRVRVVASLTESVFQGQLVLGEEAFLNLFPRIAGKRFVLMETPAGKADELATLIERDLADFGFDVETTASVIENYLSVQDTYMAAFQTLGGMGLLLGTLGLGAVVLRNVTERRQELALLSAVGFPPTSVAVMVLAETLFLLLAGLAIGLLCALVAVAPQLARLKDWSVMLPLAILLLAIVAAGLGSGWAAVRSALRVPVLSALRVERA